MYKTGPETMRKNPSKLPKKSIQPHYRASEFSINMSLFFYRHMDGAIIECKANNTLVSNPTVRSLSLDMHREFPKYRIPLN